MQKNLDLSVGRLFQLAWNDIKNNLALVAGLTLVFTLGNYSANLIFPFASVLLAPLFPGYLKCLIKVSKNESVSFEDFFWGFLDFNRLLQFVILSFLYWIAVVVLGLFLILPGIWAAVAFYLGFHWATLYQVDAIEAMKASKRIVSGRWWWSFWLMIVLIGLYCIGMLFFFVGLLITVPLAALMLLHFVKIVEESNNPLTDDHRTDFSAQSQPAPSVITVNPQS